VSFAGDRNREVDFVVRAGKSLAAIEVKSTRRRDTLPGMAAFADAFRPTGKLLVGGDGIALDAFLSRPWSVGWEGDERPVRAQRCRPVPRPALSR